MSGVSNRETTNLRKTIGLVISYEIKQRNLKNVDIIRDLRSQYMQIGDNWVSNIKSGIFHIDTLQIMCDYLNIRMSVVLTKAELYMELHDLKAWESYINDPAQDIHAL